jgi:glutaredoxin
VVPANAPRRRGLVLYSRSACRLCDRMLEALRSQLGADVLVTIVDVDSDSALKARYGEHVPVLVADGTELCRHAYDPARVAAYIAEIR